MTCEIIIVKTKGHVKLLST